MSTTTPALAGPLTDPAADAPGGLASQGGPDRILVGVDGSKPSRTALEWALTEGAGREVPVHVVLSWSIPTAVAMAPVALLADVDLEGAARQLLDGILRDERGLDNRTPASPVTSSVREGGAAAALLDAAGQGASLLVVGTRGHGGFAGLLLGSVSQQCVEHAPCPVVVVHDRANHT